MKISRLVEAIEKERGSRLLVFAASHIETESLPALYDTLREIGHVERLDVLIYCRGGVVSAARRVALLLHEFTDRLSFIVPDRCESSGTIVILAAHEIVAGPTAIFSPVDPRLQAPLSPASDQPPAISAQDIRLFGRMSQDWFGMDEDEAKLKAFSVLCENIFPTTLTSFYRSNLEVEAVGMELLSLHMGEGSGENKRRIVDQLLFGHHSHSFALNGEDMRGLGLPMGRHPAVEDLAWEIMRHLRPSVGGAARATLEDDWFDVMLATRDGSRRRRRSPGELGPSWETGEMK